MNYRWYLFWIADFLKGGKIRKAYKDIENIYYNKIDISKYQNKKINELLSYAIHNTTFYSQFKGIKDIKEFPVITKMDIKNNYDDFCSSEFSNKKLHTMSTSGSTGVPFVVKQNVEKRDRVLGELLFFNKICNYKFGEKQIFFRIWTEKNKKNKLQKFLQNIITQDISDLNDANLKSISDNLVKNKKLSNILSYASTLDILSKYMLKNDYCDKKFSIKSIVSSSEVLSEDTRENLKKIFNCNIVSRYSNQENGVLAQECIEHTEMHLNNANYFIEFLKIDSNEEADEGEICRIVITDLYNYAMPMIRYDIGDLAIYKNNSICGINTKVISKIYGRKVDIIRNTKGELMSPHVITNNMWGIENIKQFKFIQVSKNEYEININTDNKDDINEKQIIDKFIRILGKDANIQIKYVNEIPILSSGKRKYIENLYESGVKD